MSTAARSGCAENTMVMTFTNVIARNRRAVQQIFYGRSKKISPADTARSIDLHLDRKPALPPPDERQLELALPQADDHLMIPAFLRRNWA
jgi:hypothetical protein